MTMSTSLCNYVPGIDNANAYNQCFFNIFGESAPSALENGICGFATSPLSEYPFQLGTVAGGFAAQFLLLHASNLPLGQRLIRSISAPAILNGVFQFGLDTLSSLEDCTRVARNAFKALENEKNRFENFLENPRSKAAFTLAQKGRQFVVEVRPGTKKTEQTLKSFIRNEICPEVKEMRAPVHFQNYSFNSEALPANTNRQRLQMTSLLREFSGHKEVTYLQDCLPDYPRHPKT